MPRTFAVGDVHGHARRLDRLMHLLRERAGPGDSLLFVGDYVDRGPDSRGVLEQVRALASGGWDGPVVLLKGNHEAMMLDALFSRDREARGLWWQNGGEQTLVSYTGGDIPRSWDAVIPPDDLELLRGLRLWHRDEHAIYVHAGLRPGVEPEEEMESVLLWIREPFLESDHAWDRPVVFGHTPQFERSDRLVIDLEKLDWRPLNLPEKIGIDTGCAWGGPLTAVILPEREFVSVR